MNAPKLRFKEFGGEWSKVTLEELAEVERGKFSIRPRNDPRYFGGDMPFVQTGDITSSDFYLKGFSQTLNDDGVKVSKVFPSNTILITIAANIGDTAITQYPIACPDSVVAIQPNKILADTVFLKNLIDLQKDNLDSQSTQNAQKNINLQVLKPLELTTPSKPEQTKIATFLTAVDEKISQLSQKQQLLSQYKKGMMQKLFSQQIRFKADDGSEFGAWEEKLLENIFYFSRGCSISKSDLMNGGKHKTIHYGELFTKYSEIVRNVFSKSNLPDKYFGKYGDLLQPSSDVTPNGLAKVSCLNVNEVVLGGDMNILRPKSRSCISSEFMSYLINFEKFKILKCVTGTTVKHIYNKEMKGLAYNIPPLPEQTKIANFLSSIDQKIDLTTQQLEQAKQWKKGLLQQMFV